MVFIFRSRRKKSPLIIQVSDEESPDHYRRVAQKKKFDDESVRIQSLIKRIQEIDEKIKIELMAISSNFKLALPLAMASNRFVSIAILAREEDMWY
ncbi:MAG: hypothetical protein QW095_05360 [Nitrososphaerota archaeon]